MKYKFNEHRDLDQVDIYYENDDYQTSIYFQKGINKDNGLQPEHLIELAIGRLEVLNDKLPSKYNDETIDLLLKAHAKQKERLADRLSRKVEGTNNV